MKQQLFKYTQNFLALAGLCAALSVPFLVHAQVIDENPEELQRIKITEHLGDTIPLELEFTNSAGKKIKLAELFHQGKPVLLTMVYYQCPMLCTFVLNGLVDAINGLPWKPGNKFQLVSVSIKPSETAELASMKQANHLKAIDMPEDSSDWQFLVGEESQSKALAEALGFHYYLDPNTGEYAHPAAAYVLTADGKISRYIYGIQPKSQDVRLALLEASKGRIGNTLDKILLYCYRYDPSSKGYVLFARNVMKLGGVATIAVLGVFLGFWWRREKRTQTEDEPRDDSDDLLRTGTS